MMLSHLHGGQKMRCDHLDAADRRLDQYVGGVMWMRAVPLLERAKALQAELIETMVGLRYLLHEFKPDQARLREPTGKPLKAKMSNDECPSSLGGLGGETAGDPWEKGPTAISPLQATQAGASSPAARDGCEFVGTKTGRLLGDICRSWPLTAA